MQKAFSTILLIVIVVAVGIIGASVGYYYGANTTTPTTQLVTAVKTSTPKVTTTAVGATTTVVDTASWKTYTNDQYGFSLTLPDEFKGYKTRTSTNSDGSKNIWFGLPTSNKNYNSSNPGVAEAFVISVYSPATWDKIQAEGGPKPTYINRNTQYVFGYSTWQDCPSDLACDKIGASLNSIPSTFTFTK